MSLSEIQKSILPLIEKSAPVIASAIGGPIGSAAGWAIALLAHAFNSDPTDISGLAEKMTSDTDLQSKLADLDSKHGDWLANVFSDIASNPKIRMPASAEINLKLNWND